MRLAEVYPARTRFYSPGRWEPWNKLPSDTKNLQNIKNFKKIKELKEIESLNLGLSPEPIIKHYNHSDYSCRKKIDNIEKFYSKSSYRKKFYFANQAELQELPVDKVKVHLKDCENTNEMYLERYSYSSCLGNLNIVGKQLPADFFFRLSRTEEIKSDCLKHKFRKKHKMPSRLPTVVTPTPW
jgi:hypothetical protein